MSLNRIRTSKRARWLALLTAMVGIMHVQALYACADMADGQGAAPSTECCCADMEGMACDGADDCPMHDQGMQQDSCCISTWLVGTDPGGQEAALAKADAQLPHALPANFAAFVLLTAIVSPHAGLASGDSSLSQGNDTYLKTCRLRL